MTADAAASGRFSPPPAGDAGFCLAHLSDPHLAEPLPLTATDLVRKRLIGYLSWSLKRRHIHRADVLAALAADLRAQAPDHVAVTGDIVNISLASEFAAAAAWFASLGPPERVSVIPGNHDAYVRLPWQRSWASWLPYMRSDDGRTAAGRAETAGPAFPFVRRRGPLAIIGLTTAVATPPGFATGTLGSRQLAAAEAALARLAADGLFRVVLIHHPPIAAPGHYLKRLVDAGAFRAMLGRVGAELVLHGHDHRRRLYALPGADGAIPVIGAASASALPVDGHPPAEYHLCRIARADDGWRLDLRVRGIDAALGFREVATQLIEIRRTAGAAGG
jgi:3',5'-cyclic AMP phosphodiesterase CpdA